jgi:protein-tyrosine-phosphatase
VTETPVVLFLCTHNAGRSLAARVLLDVHVDVVLRMPVRANRADGWLEGANIS